MIQCLDDDLHPFAILQEKKIDGVCYPMQIESKNVFLITQRAPSNPQNHHPVYQIIEQQKQETAH